MYDVAIIGGGIAGCACAYRLARCRVRVILLEKENDICMGATRANSAIMHAGYDPHPGTLMAKLNVKGNAMSREICKKLHVSWKDTGSLVVALNDEDMDTLQDLLERGRENGVPGLELWDAAQVRAKAQCNGDSQGCFVGAYGSHCQSLGVWFGYGRGGGAKRL